MRILAVDYGKARVGIAITDPLGVISQPLETFSNTSDKAVIRRLKYLVEENSVHLVLIGNPLSLNGGKTAMSDHIECFAERMRKALAIKVVLWDERFTSKYAQIRLQEMGIQKGNKKLDQIAACILLDEYLNTRTQCTP